MYQLLYENENGILIDLFSIPDLQITDVKGLGYTTCTGTYSKRADMDGEELDALTFEKRNIELTFRMTGGLNNTQTRRFIYNLFAKKQKRKLYYKDEDLNVYTYVIAESIDPTIWSNTPAMSISLIAPSPYFVTDLIIGNARSVQGRFIFPLEIINNYQFGIIEETAELKVINNGQVESPLHLILTINSETIINPTVNINGKGFFRLNKDFSKNDEIHIITKKGEKEVYLMQGETKTDLFSYISSASQWLQLATGENIFTLSSDTENGDMSLKIMFEENYIGIE